jgi:transcriptional regulator with XRE-family HTH domain
MTHNAAELRHFLVAARARISPQSLGLPTSRRRQVPGLRREEVAALIGVSEEWYARFESGRAQLSLKALRRLASVLQLDALASEAFLRLSRPDIGDTNSPLGRAKRSCVRVGTFDLPIAQDMMLKGAAAVACSPGLAMEHVPRSWIEQAHLLERGEVDVAVTYRFPGIPAPPELEEAVFGEESATHVMLNSAPGFRDGAIDVGDIAHTTLSAPIGRFGDDMIAHAKAAGMPSVRVKAVRSTNDIVSSLSNDSAFGIVTDDYAKTMRELGVDCRKLRDFGINSNLVLRWRRGVPNPALHRFLEGAVG